METTPKQDAPPSTSSVSLPDGSIAERQNLASHSAGTSGSTLSSSPEEQTVEGDGVSPSPPVADSLHGSVSADSLASCSILPAPAPVEAPPSEDSQDVGADDYAFTCGQAMPDSLSSQVIDSPTNDRPVGHNVVVVEGGQATDPPSLFLRGRLLPQTLLFRTGVRPLTPYLCFFEGGLSL